MPTHIPTFLNKVYELEINETAENIQILIDSENLEGRTLSNILVVKERLVIWFTECPKFVLPEIPIEP